MGRGASEKSSPPAPGGRNEGFPAGSVFDLARFQFANGASGGAGNSNPPRTGPYNRVPRTESSNRCRRMKFCERRRKEGRFWQERKRRNNQEKDPSTLKVRSHQAERWRVQEKRKEEK